MILVMVVPIPSPGHIKHPPEAMVAVGDLHILNLGTIKSRCTILGGWDYLVCWGLAITIHNKEGYLPTRGIFMAHLCDVYVFVIHPGPVACYLVSTTSRHFLGIPWKIMWRFSGMGHGPCSSHDTGSCPHSSWCDGILYKVFDFGSADSTGASFANRAEVLSANTVFDKLKELGHKCHKSIEFAMPLPCLCHAFHGT